VPLSLGPSNGAPSSALDDLHSSCTPVPSNSLNMQMGHGPLKAGTAVRIRLGPPYLGVHIWFRRSRPFLPREKHSDQTSGSQGRATIAAQRGRAGVGQVKLPARVR
jgi:hypothetical protein